MRELPEWFKGLQRGLAFCITALLAAVFEERSQLGLAVFLCAALMISASLGWEENKK